MSKKVKSLIIKELGSRFEGVESVAVINPRGINAIKNNQIRRKLHEKGLRMTVVKNTLAKKAVGEGALKGFDALLDGPSAVIYGDASASVIARLLVDEKKADETLELRGVFFDGEVFAGEKGVEQVSKFPTREEAIGQVLAAVMGPGASVLGALLGPGSTVASLVKAVEEKAEKTGGGEAAAPAPAAG